MVNNRIVGCTRDTLPWLDKALDLFNDSGRALHVGTELPRVDVAARDGGTDSVQAGAPRRICQSKRDPGKPWK